MLLSPPIPFLRRRSPRTLELMLVSASYDVSSSVTLTFNQPIDLTDIALNSVELDDGPGGKIYTGSNATPVDPFTVRIALLYITSAGGSDIVLNVDVQNKIEAVESGQKWAGASGLALPYPPAP